MKHFRTVLQALIVLAGAIPAEASDEPPGNGPQVPGANLQPARAPSGPPVGPDKGTLILCSVHSHAIIQRFITLAGGPDAHLVLVLNSAPPSSDRRAAAERTARSWGVRNLTVWHAADAESASAGPFLEALTRANGVWFPGGRIHYYDPFLNKRTRQHLKSVLDRGGVIGGESAGAIMQSSHLPVSWRSPVTQPPTAQPTDCYDGFGFLLNVVLIPHLEGKMPLKKCQQIISDNAGLVGLGLDESAAVIVHENTLEVIGKGKVTILSGDHNVREVRSGERIPQAARTAPSKPGASDR